MKPFTRKTSPFMTATNVNTKGSYETQKYLKCMSIYFMCIIYLHKHYTHVALLNYTFIRSTTIEYTFQPESLNQS